MEKIPESWRKDVLGRWNQLVAMNGLLWDFSLEKQDTNGDIFLRAQRKIRSDDHIKLEVINPVDIDNVEKVCQKINALEAKIRNSQTATA